LYKENAFELVQDESNFKIFKGKDKYLGIVFYEEAISDFKKAIKKIKDTLILMFFRWATIPRKTVCGCQGAGYALRYPEVILKVYREIFK